ncbi:MAG: flagellar hook-length control protein FliK [Deltaproteobacteria bacterium]|nr:flagellar hook-length control protein FliK [Deltaproteobacteria bacterium]
MDVLSRISSLVSSLTPQVDADPALEKGATIKAEVVDNSVPGQVTLRLGQRLFQALVSDNLDLGQEVKLTVVATSPKLVLSLAANNEADSPPLSAADTERIVTGRSLPQEPMIQARVLESARSDIIRLKITAGRISPDVFPENKVDLAVGKEVTARLLLPPGSDREFPPGQEIKFTVVQTSPRLILQPMPMEVWPESGVDGKATLKPALTRFISQPDQLTTGVMELLTAPSDGLDLPDPVKNRLDHLIRLLAKLSPQSGPADEEFVKRLTQALGLSGSKPQIHEAVAKLYSEVIRAAENEVLKDSPEIRNLMEAAAKIFKAADQIRTINQEVFSQDQTIHLAFPLSWSNQTDRGEMLFKKSPPARPGSEEGPLKVALLLSMSRLGCIKVDLEVKNKVINGVIWTENRDTSRFFRQHLDRLVSSLTARGLQVQSIRVQIFPTDRRPPDTLADELKPGRRSLIDFKV